MGSLQWAWSSGQPWGSRGSLWSWGASRLPLDWTARFFREDEETLVLTQADELNRTYGEDSSLPPNSTRPSSSRIPEKTASPGRINSPESFKQVGPDFKDTRVSLNPNRSSTTARTSILCPQDRGVLNDTQTVSGERTWSAQNRVSGKHNPSSNQTDQTNSKRSYRPARQHKEETAGEDQASARNDKPAPVERVPSHCQLDGPPSKEGGGGGGGGTAGERDGRGEQVPRLKPTITTWEAGWNITNAVQGIFVLGLPHALVHSGYMGLVVLVLSAWVCNHTGKVLVACLYEEEHSAGLERVRVRRSYQEIAVACCEGLWPNWARLGGFMVNVAQVIELLMTCTLYLVVSTSLLSDNLSWMALPRSVCSLVALMFLLPCLLLTDLKLVSTLSMLCSLAHILISLLVILYCLSAARGWSLSPLSLAVDPEDFLVSVGVIIFSYTCQIFLPPLEGSMEDREQFPDMLGLTHAAACVMKTMFSLLAVLTWGAETSEVITDNLPPDLRPLVNLCLLAKALLSYPLPFYSAAEILQTCLIRGGAASKSFYFPGRGLGVSRPVLVARGALLMTSYLLALLVPRFSLLMGLTGSVTGAAMTLILPCLFHLRLRWSRLKAKEKLTDVVILSLGVVCSTSGVICSVKRVIEGL